MNHSAQTPEAVPAETAAMLEALSASLRQALADHQSMLAALLARHAELPLALGELLEDTGNAYLEMSESVSRSFLLKRAKL